MRLDEQGIRHEHARPGDWSADAWAAADDWDRLASARRDRTGSSTRSTDGTAAGGAGDLARIAELRALVARARVVRRPREARPARAARPIRSGRPTRPARRALASIAALALAVGAHLASAPPAALAATAAAEPPATPAPDAPSISSGPAPSADPSPSADPAQPGPVGTIDFGAGVGPDGQPIAQQPGAPAASAAPEQQSQQPATTWDEVGAAAGNTLAADALIGSINAQISALETAVASAAETAAAAGAAYEQARTEAENRRSDVMVLDAQILEAEQTADDSAASLGTMAVHLRDHTAGFEPGVVTFFNTSPDDDFLYRITAINRFSDNEDAMYQQAMADQETLGALRVDAQAALDEAVALEAEAQSQRDAAIAAQLQLQAQQGAAIEAKAQFEAMLGVLGEGRAPTQADLDAVLQAQQDAFAAGQAAFAQAGLSAESLGASATGAYSPILGARITDSFGMRLHPVEHVVRMHWGTDYAIDGGTCGAPLYAVRGGTVLYAGPMGGLGNVVQLDLGDGTRLLYGHLLDGGIGVGTGTSVAAGQPIGLAGSTGQSTGCHLHLEVESNGARLDPHAWVVAQGAAQ
ncbi:Lysostaphin [Pseudoclavibacter triregionum]|nr:Lysostaphin [Pseudoclavibacter triregionum]